jgi:hypothetical protein
VETLAFLVALLFGPRSSLAVRRAARGPGVAVTEPSVPAG